LKVGRPGGAAGAALEGGSTAIRKEHWLVWLAAKAWSSTWRESPSAGQLLAALFAADREFARRYGRRLLDFEYTAWLNGLYSYEFYEALEEAADAGLVEYEVSVELPEAPGCGGDEDCRLAAVQHELSRVDAEERYVKRTVRPLAEAAEPPPDLLRLLEGVGATLGELELLVEKAVEVGVRAVGAAPSGAEVGQAVSRALGWRATNLQGLL